MKNKKKYQKSMKILEPFISIAETYLPYIHLNGYINMDTLVWMYCNGYVSNYILKTIFLFSNILSISGIRTS